MKKLFLFFFILLFSKSGYAQLADSIVGLTGPVGSVAFCKIDIATGGISTYQVIAYAISNHHSYCIDNNNKIYYFCTGDSLIAIDAISAKVISKISLPILPGSIFWNIRFNPCDEKIYGFIENNNSFYFSKYNPLTKFLDTISFYSSTPGISPLGVIGYLDSDSGLYVLNTGNGLTAIDIKTGKTKYSTQYVTSNGENFGKIAFDCRSRKVIGISTNIQSINSGHACLSTVNPYTGQVTHISNTMWNIGYWSPGYGGECINQNTGDYYYPTHCGTNFIEANTLNGTIINSFVTNLTNTDFYFIDHFSSCKCNSTISTDVDEIASKSRIYFNYLSGELVVGVNSSNIHIFNSRGQVIFESNLSEIRTIDTESFPSGIYFYRVIGKNSTIETGKFVK